MGILPAQDTHVCTALHLLDVSACGWKSETFLCKVQPGKSECGIKFLNWLKHAYMTKETTLSFLDSPLQLKKMVSFTQWVPFKHMEKWGNELKKISKKLQVIKNNLWRADKQMLLVTSPRFAWTKSAFLFSLSVWVDWDNKPLKWTAALKSLTDLKWDNGRCWRHSGAQSQ